MPHLHSCPRCGHIHSWFLRRHHRRCRRCRTEWSPHSVYPVFHFYLHRRDWLRLIDAFLREGTIKAVENECRCAHGTAHKAVFLVRRVMTADVPALLAGICEADETYVGGAWKNKAIHIRRQGTKRGRGTSKQCIFGVAQRTPRPSQVRVWLVANARGRTLMPLIRDVVVPGSTLYTDGHKPYRRLPRYHYLHDWVDHDAGEYVRGKAHTQTIDGYWGLLKTHLDSRGGIRKERSSFFIGEHVWRYNFRHLSRREQVKRLYRLLTKFGGKS